jgi:hypothetical protein
LDFYRPRNITGSSKLLAQRARRNHWLGEYVYNLDNPNPNEIRPEEDPLINSGGDAPNSIISKQKRPSVYYDVPLVGEYFEYRLSPKLRLQDAYNRNVLYRDRYQKSLLREKRTASYPVALRHYRENEPFIDYTGDYNRLDGEKSGNRKLWDLYYAHM